MSEELGLELAKALDDLIAMGYHDEFEEMQEWECFKKAKTILAKAKATYKGKTKWNVY